MDKNSLNLGQQGTNTYPRDDKKVRDEYCEYFNGNGKVSWQDNFIAQRRSPTLNH